jgi:hypothetical protein
MITHSNNIFDGFKQEKLGFLNSLKKLEKKINFSGLLMDQNQNIVSVQFILIYVKERTSLIFLHRLHSK